MRVLFYGILLISVSLFLGACNSHSETLSLLRESGRIVETDPEKALFLLDSISNPEEMSEYHLMEYHVRIVQARYKNFIPVSSDTAIFKARDYFTKKVGSNWQLSFLGYFYSGCVYREREQYEYAVKEYKQALHIAEQYKDEEQQAFVLYNIGNLYFNKRSYGQALEYYRLAVNKYDGHYSEMMVCLHAVAQAALLCDKIDDALFFFEKGLNLAEKQNDKVQAVNFLHDKAIALYNQHEYEEALLLLYQAKELEPDTTQFARYYLNLANIYKDIGKRDSTALYTRKLLESIDEFSDTYFGISANKFLAEVFAANGDYHTAAHHLQVQNSKLVQIVEEDNVKALAEAERKYNLSLKKTQLAKEKARNYRLSLILSIIGWLLLLITGGGFYYYRKHQREREKNLRLQNETKKNAYLNQVYLSCLGNISQFKNSVNDIAVSYAKKNKKETLTAGYAKIEKAIAEMEISIHSGYAPFVADFLHSLKLMNDEQFGMLKPEEQLLVTLLYAKHEHSQIASLLRINSHALSARKSRLKNKLLNIGLVEEQILSIFSSK